MAAMTKFDLSHAYPFMSLNFVIVLLASNWLLNEPITPQKALGVFLIILGTIVAARG
jgi:drug/metabolite transporter (DMT)-like permease